MPTQEKLETVEDLKTRLNGVTTVLLAEYRGLTVQQLSELRKQLKAVSAEYKIVKNRLGNSNLDAIFPGFVPTFRGVTKDAVSGRITSR